MNIHHVSQLSGLSRGQINQLISRHGYTPHAKPQNGEARSFTKADAFDLVVAGRLARLGLGQAWIAEALAALPIPQVDPNTFEQIEVFPGRRKFSHEGASAVLVIDCNEAGNFTAEFAAASDLPRILARTHVAVVLNADDIANTIEQLADR